MRGDFSLLLETATAEHWPALRRFKGNSGFYTALRTCGAGFGSNLLVPTNPFGLALLAALGVVFELFVVKEHLLARRKDELGATVNARQYPIGEFHGRLP